MKFTFLPKSKLGSLSLVLFVVMIVLISFFFLMINVFNQKGGETFFSNLYLTVPMILAWALGCGALVTGIIDLIKPGKRSVIIILIVALCLLTTFYGVAEVLSPH